VSSIFLSSLLVVAPFFADLAFFFPFSQDAKNIARILIEVESRGIILEPNRFVRPGDRRWGWMGEKGTIIWERSAQE